MKLMDVLFPPKRKWVWETGSVSFQEIEKADASLKGMVGHALTQLRLVGYIEVNGKRFEAKSESGLIQEGETVRVVGYSFGVLQVVSLKKMLGIK